MANFFDKFDEDVGGGGGNYFDRYDREAPTPPPEKPAFAPPPPGSPPMAPLAGAPPGKIPTTADEGRFGEDRTPYEAMTAPLREAWSEPGFHPLDVAKGAGETALMAPAATAAEVVKLFGGNPRQFVGEFNEAMPGIIGAEMPEVAPLREGAQDVEDAERGAQTYPTPQQAVTMFALRGQQQRGATEDAGTAALKNIAEGKPSTAPRPEAPAPSTGEAPAAKPQMPAPQQPVSRPAPAGAVERPAGTPAPTASEPRSDIEAQLKALADPAHPKDAVFVARGNESALPAETPQGVRMVKTPDGTLFTTNPAKAVQFARGPRDDATMARILDYPQPKDQVLKDIAAGRPASVIQARDANGNVVSEAVASDRGRQATRQALGKQGQLTEISPQQALARRKQLIAQEQGQPPAQAPLPWAPGRGMWNAPPAPEEAAAERNVAGRPVGEVPEPTQTAAPAAAPAPAEEEPPPFEGVPPISAAPASPAREIARGEPPPRAAATKRPPDLVEFLADSGGLSRDEGGDLEAMDAHKKFVPGRGQLVRKTGGMSLDEAREAAEEAGYLPEGSDINDLLGALDDNLRGRHVFSDRDLSQAEDWRSEQGEERAAALGQSTREPVEDTPPWQDRTLDFAEHQSRTGLPPHEAAAEWVKDAGKTGREYGVIVDHSTGRVLEAGTSADPRGLRLSPAEEDALMDERNEHVIHHNHPNNGSLSSRDLAMLGFPGLRAVVAHANDGDMSAARLSERARAFFEGMTPDDIWSAVHYVSERVVNKLVAPLKAAYERGEITLDAGNKALEEIKNRALNTIGLIDYMSQNALKGLPKSLARDLMRKAEGSAATHAREFGFRPKGLFHAGLPLRSTGAFRADRPFGAFLAGGREIPEGDAGRTRGAGSNQARQGGIGLAAPRQVEEPPSPAYQQALERSRQASRVFREAQEAYRAHRIGDDEFLAARRAHDAANRDFDAADAAERARQRARPAPPTRDLLESEGQRVLPGAEANPEADRAAQAQSDKARAEQQMKGGLRPKTEQEDFGSTGLGGNKGKQGSLFGAPRQLPVTTPQQVRRNGIIARSVIGKIFSPSTVGPSAERTAGLAREERGQARRLTQQARASLEEFRNSTPQLGTPEGDQLMFYIEGRSAGVQLQNAAMRPVADMIRALNKDRQNALRQLPGQQQRQFISDYFEHMWDLTGQQAQQAAARWLSTSGGGTGQGSGRMLKQRTVPTYADGMAMGLQPRYPNIVDGEMASIANVDRFIATNRILMRMKAEGLAREFFPGQQPDGWSELGGTLVDKARPMSNSGAAPTHTYAPEDAARVYNNMISRGVYDTAAGPLYDKLLRFKNFQTMAELSFSAFHASTMATEAMFSQIGRSVGLLKEGRPIEAGKVFATFPIAPVRNYMSGRKMAAEYIEPGSQAPDVAQAMGLLSRANMSPIGRGEAQYFASGKRAFGAGVTQGGIKAKAAGMALDLKNAFRDMGKDLGSADALGFAKHVGENMARTMDTISAPLFDHAIPRLKAGAALDRMRDWLNAHPGASVDDQLKAARDISDSIDNRFGELNYDNVFWHSAMKQVAFLGLRAFGWDLGTHREIEGGIADIARGRWSPRVEYLVGLAVGSTLLNGTMSYLKTGKPPTSAMDFFAYDTGHQDAHGHEIRAMLPGYAREYVTLAMNMFARGGGPALQGYGYGKLASTWSTAWDLLTNRDYRDDPIGPPGAGVSTARARAQLPEFLKRYTEDALDRFVPINWRAQLGIEPQRDMSALSPAEQAIAARPAPFAVQAPMAARGFFAHRAADPQSAEKRWHEKLKRERRAEQP